MRYYTFLLLILLSCSTLAFGQQSKIYNDRGQLIADTSFSISKEQLQLWNKNEDTLVSQILHTVKFHMANFSGGNYPREYQNSIFSFKINGDLLCNFKLIQSLKNYDYGGTESDLFWELNRAKIYIPGLSKVTPSTYSMYYLPFHVQLNGTEQIRKLKNGYLWYTNPTGGYDTLDGVLSRWMDSLDIVFKGHFDLMKFMNQGKGQWHWNYYKGKWNCSIKGNPNTDTFTVYKDWEPRGVIAEDGGGSQRFTYFSCERKLQTEYGGRIYLTGKGPVFYNIGSMSLVTLHDTLYKGYKDALVHSPMDSSKYFVFTNCTRICKYIVGKEVKIFESDNYHREGGTLATCTYLSNYNGGEIISTNKDSVIYVYFKGDTFQHLHRGDTILGEIDPQTLSDTAHRKSILYHRANQVLPIKVNQIADVTWLNRRFGAVASWSERHKDWVFGNYSDPVMTYMRKKGIIIKYK